RVAYAPPRTSNAYELTAALQGSPTYVGKEIDALETVRGMSAAARAAFLSAEGPDEPVIVSILDLARHEDPQLSHKAAELAASVDGTALFARKLADPKTRAMYSAALPRLDPKLALNILAAAPPANDLAAIRKQILSGGTPRLIAPTSSAEGDRYW